jgi:hypothetical protein
MLAMARFLSTKAEPKLVGKDAKCSYQANFPSIIFLGSFALKKKSVSGINSPKLKY